MRLVQPVLVAVVLVAEQRLLDGGLVAEDLVFVVSDSDLARDLADVLRPQLHRVTYELDLAPESFVGDVGQEKALLFFLQPFVRPDLTFGELDLAEVALAAHAHAPAPERERRKVKHGD